MWFEFKFEKDQKMDWKKLHLSCLMKEAIHYAHIKVDRVWNLKQMFEYWTMLIFVRSPKQKKAASI